MNAKTKNVTFSRRFGLAEQGVRADQRQRDDVHCASRCHRQHAGDDGCGHGLERDVGKEDSPRQLTLARRCEARRSLALAAESRCSATSSAPGGLSCGSGEPSLTRVWTALHMGGIDRQCAATAAAAPLTGLVSQTSSAITTKITPEIQKMSFRPTWRPAR